MIRQDPILERERVLIGGAIVGEVPWAQADKYVRHIDHRRIVDALMPARPRGVAQAIVVAQGAGLPPELRGGFDGETPVGYLAGCVRVYKESVNTVARER